MHNVASRPQKANNAGTAALVKELQALASEGQLRSLRVFNNGASACFMQLHDVATTPAEGTVPLMTFPLEAGAYYESDTPLDVANGLYVCGSSTAATKTLIATADLLILGGKN